MNERFKFRVWNKQQQKLYSWNDLKETKKDSSFFWCMIQAQNDEKNNILMQCTGLKDKNGKLIYEGDILKFYAQSIIDAMAREPLKERIGVAVWNEEELKFDVSVDNGKNVVPNLCKKTDDNNFEIIGNIYENKDLLKEQK